MTHCEKAEALVRETYPDATVYRVLDGGEHVSVHYTRSDENGTYVAIDVFRFDGSEPVMRLINAQPAPGKPNPSGHTMVDGPRIIDYSSDAKENCSTVVALMKAIMSGETAKMPDFFEGDRYINHNPEAYDGLSGFARGMKERLARGIVTKYEDIVLAFGAGDFVQMVTEGSLSGVPTMFFDIFRLENGKIAEHWDVVAPK